MENAEGGTGRGREVSQEGYCHRQSYRDGKQMGAWGWGIRGGGRDCTWAQRILLGGQNILKLDRGDGYATCQIVKPLNCTLKMGEFESI